MARKFKLKWEKSSRLNQRDVSSRLWDPLGCGTSMLMGPLGNETRVTQNLLYTKEIVGRGHGSFPY